MQNAANSPSAYQTEPNVDHFLPIFLHSELGLTSEKPPTSSSVKRKRYARNLSDSGNAEDRF